MEKPSGGTEITDVSAACGAEIDATVLGTDGRGRIRGAQRKTSRGDGERERVGGRRTEIVGEKGREEQKERERCGWSEGER